MEDIDYKQNIADAIQYIREKLGTPEKPATMKAVADHIGVSTTYIYRCISSPEELSAKTALRIEQATEGQYPWEILCSTP